MRTALLFAATVAVALLLVWGQAPAATLLAMLGMGVALYGLWTLVHHDNAELARFVTALERGDLTQSFQRWADGSSFGLVAAAYDRALARLRAERADSAASAHFAEALADGAPIALLVLDGDTVAIVNKAARRLFGRSGSLSMATLASVASAFVTDLVAVTPGDPRLSLLTIDGVTQRVSLDATFLEAAGALRRIVAVRVVQPELDRAELTAQIDLVRVLTHEIMNSLTPVTSLAATAHRLTDALDPALAPGIADARLAAAAVARRAAELERFVESYKGFSEAPVLVREPIELANWLDQVARLFAATSLGAAVPVTIVADPRVAAIDGDVALLTQVLLNLLKNAAEAMVDIAEPAVTLISAMQADGRIRLSVIDTGPGIPPPLHHEVFLPFFTTKATGTGIGLSFARQIVLLHGGQIAISRADASGIDLLLPTSARR
ncbi:sensor histidine kinase [Sphingomonas sp. 1P08PE]|uniref:sensor histidine kinase n=1 Tax=Sphingomonas sp. 1P08PE TaxID=554122 RepID=UPI0039A19A4C